MFRHNDEAMMFQLPVYLDARDVVVERGIESVLDIGCGNPQKLRAFIMPFVSRIIGLDLPEVIERIDVDFGEWIGVDLEKNRIDLKQKFGLIICADVIEHLSDPSLLLKIIREHSDSSTIVMLSTPEKNSHKTPEHVLCVNTGHKIEYTKEEMVDLLQRNGFIIEWNKSYTEENSAIKYVSNIFICRREA